MKLSAGELLQLAQQAGSGGDPSTAAAVALAESGGDPSAVGRNDDQWGSRDRGLWQINDHWHPEVSDGCAFDPGCSARAAYTISSGWTDFSPWATYQSGAYRQFLPGLATVQQAPAQRSLYGQEHVGELLTSPWFPGSWEVTQGWGPTSYEGEPEGHGFSHWHAGVDVGVQCGTTITLPMGLSGRVRALDNPGGYGTALVVLLDGSNVGILLGHLRQRLVDDGSVVSGGTPLAVSNSTGNSTGCHVHFEVRPQDPKQPTGLARYGNDVDPSAWLTAGQAGTSAELLSATTSNPLADALGRVGRSLLAGAQVLLGAGMVVGGLIAAAYGMRGQGAQALQRDATRTARRLARPRRQPQSTRAPESLSPAAESRIRPDLQRKPGAVRDLAGRGVGSLGYGSGRVGSTRPIRYRNPQAQGRGRTPPHLRRRP